jgi:hypothetical protein
MAILNLKLKNRPKINKKGHTLAFMKKIQNAFDLRFFPKSRETPHINA